MAFIVKQSGVTGPEGRIGSGTSYHIDSKFARSGGIEAIVPRMDAIAAEYAKDGRNIVFSNSGVQGLVYDPSAPLETKIDLITRADAAHSHSVSPNFYSLDYYAPVGTDIWDPSAEGAPIYVVGQAGRSIESGVGGGYGAYSAVIGADNNVLMKSGHGDIQGFKLEPLSSFEGTTAVIPTAAASVTPSTPQETALERALNYKDMSAAQLNTEYDRLRKESPDTAADEGMKMHLAYFGKN